MEITESIEYATKVREIYYGKMKKYQAKAKNEVDPKKKNTAKVMKGAYFRKVNHFDAIIKRLHQLNTIESAISVTEEVESGHESDYAKECAKLRAYENIKEVLSE